MKSKIVITNGYIFDGSGRPPYKGIVVVENDVIVDIGSEGEVTIPDDAKVIDVKGMLVMPGLVDAHLHITGFKTGDVVKEPLITPFGVFFARAVNDLKALIDAGFTAIGDAGGLISLHLKYAVNEGSIVGPRIVAAGPALSQTFGHGDEHYLPVEWVDLRTTKKLTPFACLICDGVDECRKAARYALREGADFIKIMASGGVVSEKDRPEYTQFTVDEIRAIVEEAESARRFVHAHAEGAKGIINALKAGVKVIAHAIYINDEGINLALEKNAVVIPTLSIAHTIMELGESTGLPEWALKKLEEVHQIHKENIRNAYRNGVKLATGTDFFGGPFRHGQNALELRLLVDEIGMKPIEVLVSATKIAAEAIGLEDRIGLLREGMKADIIVIKGNPIEDIAILQNTENIQLVMKDGNILKKTFNIA